jgi:hypothetical protein
MMEAYAHEFLQCEVMIGSRRHIMSKCVYFAFRTIVLFEVIFLKKHVFSKEELSNEMIWNYIYIVFIVALVCHMYFYNQIQGEIRTFESAQILPDFVFCLENLS